MFLTESYDWSQHTLFVLAKHVPTIVIAYTFSRFSGFLSVMLTNTEIFLRGLKLSGETGSY